MFGRRRDERSWQRMQPLLPVAVGAVADHHTLVVVCGVRQRAATGLKAYLRFPPRTDSMPRGFLWHGRRRAVTSWCAAASGRTSTRRTTTRRCSGSTASWTQSRRSCRGGDVISADSRAAGVLHLVSLDALSTVVAGLVEPSFAESARIEALASVGPPPRREAWFVVHDEGGDMPDPIEPCLDAVDGEADEWDEENNDLLYLKYCFEGAATLADLTAMLRSLADELERRVTDGWRLVEPVDGGRADLMRADS